MPPFPTTGQPGDYAPGYTGPTDPATPLVERLDAAYGTPQELGYPFDLGSSYLPPGFNVIDVRLVVPVGNGNETDWTIPAGCLACLQAAFFNFVSDATVGTRDVSVEWRLQDGTHIGEMNVNTSTYTAGTNRETFLAIGLQNYVNDTLVHDQLPVIWLPEGAQIGIASGGTGGTGDHFTNGPKLSVMVMPRPRMFAPPIETH